MDLAPFRDALKAVSSKIVTVRTGTVVNSTAGGKTTAVQLDNDTSGQATSAMTVAGPLTKGNRVACLAFPGGGLLVLGRLDQVDTIASLRASITSILATLSAAFPLGTGAYTPYTPVWTAGASATTLGNGTLTGAYTKVGRTVRYRITLTWGSTTSAPAGAWLFTLPSAAVSTGWSGGARILDASPSAQYYRHAFLNSSTQVALSDAAPSTFVQATVPITFAVGDQTLISGHYESTT
jgi:hypothetical protein